MEASATDRRLLQPVSDDTALRRCRNCQAVIDVASDAPLIAEALAST